MLTTQHPALRCFWYPVAKVADLNDAPRAITLLGEALVLWRIGENEFGVVKDKCPHRSAKLSNGWIDQGNLVCPYHGWTYNGGGSCVRIPQLPQRKPSERIVVQSHRCKPKYGYVWVALDEPLHDIPEFPEASNPQFYQIDEFIEVWNCSGLRILENGLDNSHFAFVHRKTFGLAEMPEPAPARYEDTDLGFNMYSDVLVNNPGPQKDNLDIKSEQTTRYMEHNWFAPFGRRMRIRYPNDLVHTIITWATPINDRQSLFIQFAFRNDGASNPNLADIIAWDRAVTSEDRVVLESTDWNTPLDLNEEFHMASDMPGIKMRRKINAIFEQFGNQTSNQHADVLDVNAY
ncbi:aromatic ring-hydroxylating dioxygenase subunit alpha [Burkholderia sp. JP2-270]|nr:aromatic ring-hydroxylating dioxygenase subunit alpha [Burkholderia sp. JP2-270]